MKKRIFDFTRRTISNENSDYLYVDKLEKNPMPELELLYHDPQQGIESTLPQDPPWNIYKSAAQYAFNYAEPKLVYEQEGSLVIESKKLEVSKPYTVTIGNVEYTVIKTKDGKIEIHEFTPD
jgi:hypothetical protein